MKFLLKICKHSFIYSFNHNMVRHYYVPSTMLPTILGVEDKFRVIAFKKF